MNGILIFAAIVFGVFQIVLLIKIWNMTNDVRVLKENSFEQTKIRDAQIMYMAGEDKEKIKKVLDQSLFGEIMNINETFRYIPDYKIALKKTRDRYKEIYDKMKVEMPDTIQYDDKSNLPI